MVVKVLFFLVVFLISFEFGFPQSQALKYPEWVYRPQEKKGMVSAIAYDFGETQWHAIRAAELKSKGELKKLIEKTVREMTINTDSLLFSEQLVDDLLQTLNENIDTLLDRSEVREMMVEKEENSCRGIVLIDLDIDLVKEYIRYKIEYDPVLKHEKEERDLLKPFLSRLKDLESFIKSANH